MLAWALLVGLALRLWDGASPLPRCDELHIGDSCWTLHSLGGNVAPTFPPGTPIGVCPICRGIGITSIVRGADDFSVHTCCAVACTPNEFYDESGRFHVHSQCHPCCETMTSWTCSRGHAWNIKDAPNSCWCGWTEDEVKK